MPQGNPDAYASPGPQLTDINTGIDVRGAGKSTFADTLLNAAYGMPPILGHAVGAGALAAGGGSPRGRMANALADVFAKHRAAQGGDIKAAFKSFIQSPELAEAMITDPSFSANIDALAKQVARGEDPAAAFGRGVQQAQGAGLISPRQAQGMNIMGSVDLATAIERFGQELLPSPETLASIAKLEQESDHFGRSQALEERKLLWSQKKFFLEQDLALDPELDDVLKFGDRFREEAKPYIQTLQGYEKVRALRGKPGTEVSDAAISGIILSYLQMIKPSVSGATASRESEEMADDGLIFPDVLGRLRRYYSGDKLTAPDVDRIVAAAEDLAVMSAEGYRAISEAFTNTAQANFPRTELSRDELKERTIPKVVKPETLDFLKAKRQQRRDQDDKAAINETRARTGLTDLRRMSDDELRSTAETIIAAIEAGQEVSPDLRAAVAAELQRRGLK